MENVVYTGVTHFTNTSTNVSDVLSQKWYLDDVYITDTENADIDIQTPGIHKVKLCLIGICPANAVCIEHDVRVVAPSLPQINKVTSLLEVTAEEPFSYDFDNIPGYGVGTMTWSAQNIPQGVVLNPTTGVMSGRINNIGDYNVQITVTDSIGGTDSYLFTIHSNAPSLSNVVPDFTVESIKEIPLSIYSTIPDGVQGTPYFHTINAIGGYGKIVWTITGLPNGLTGNSVMGWIKGTPTETGSFDVTIEGTDLIGNTVRVIQSMVVS